MTNPVEGLFEVYDDMAVVLLVLEKLLTENSYVEDQLCGAPTCSEACLFFSNYLLACGFDPFGKIFSITFLGWLLRLIVR